MQEITKENVKHLKEEYFTGACNVLYGAGDTGRQVGALLDELGIATEYCVDDDETKQGKSMDGKPIISRTELAALAEKQPVNVILASLYAKPMEQKLQGLPVQIFSIFGLYMSDEEHGLTTVLKLSQPEATWLEKMQKVKALFPDTLSRRILGVLEQVGKERRPDGRLSAPHQDWFAEIASSEEHCFVDPVPRLLDDTSVLVDCGAYTGDMLGQLVHRQIPFGKIYAIEANPSIFETLQKQAVNLGVQDKTKAINCGVWNEPGVLEFQVSEIHPTGGQLLTGGAQQDGFQTVSVRTDTLDHLIDEPVDFLKMDIEGAELPALHGATRLLDDCRPILAISIYHSLDDLADIPLFLYERMKDYTFFLRHHSFTVGESVMYGIPNERNA